MKKVLLSISTLVLALNVSAQLTAAGDGFLLDNTSSTSNCYLNSAPNNGGVMAYGNTITKGPNFILSSSGPLTLIAESIIPTGGDAIWFGFPAIEGTGDNALCSTLYDGDKGIDLTGGLVNISAKAEAIGDSLEFFVGSGGQYYPTTSTYNIGNVAGTSIIAKYGFQKAGEYETITFDYTQIDAVNWAAWAGKSKVQSFGFRVIKGTKFEIAKIGLGTESTKVSVSKVEAASDFTVAPNPADESILVSFVSTESALLEVSDISGSVVISSAVSAGSNRVQLNTSSLQAGVYFVSVKSSNGISVKKVIIR